MLTPGADPVRKVSIIPRGMALGVTFSAPDADRYNYLQAEVLAKIKVALGGRAAEEIVFGEISTGAESDIQQLTRLARQMVGRWGMSDAVGPVAVIPRDGSGPFLPGASEVSPETQRLLDDEVRRIVDEAHEEVLALLRENRQRARLARAGAARARDARRGRRLRGRRRRATPGAVVQRAGDSGSLADVEDPAEAPRAGRRDPLDAGARRAETACAGTIGRPPPSTSGLGHHPFKSSRTTPCEGYLAI